MENAANRTQLLTVVGPSISRRLRREVKQHELTLAKSHYFPTRLLAIEANGYGLVVRRFRKKLSDIRLNPIGQWLHTIPLSNVMLVLNRLASPAAKLSFHPLPGHLECGLFEPLDVAIQEILQALTGADSR